MTIVECENGLLLMISTPVESNDEPPHNTMSPHPAWFMKSSNETAGITGVVDISGDYFPVIVDDGPTDAAAGPQPFIDRVLMFTDIEGSSTRWDHQPDAMRLLMRHHDATVTEVVTAYNGVLGARTGDGAIALFRSATDAARSALALQSRIGAGPRVAALDCDPLRVRIGLHRGVVEPRDGEHYGPAMHRTARIMSTAHGGQIVVSAVVATELEQQSSADFVLEARGAHRLKGFHEPERISELLAPGTSPERKGLRTAVHAGSIPTVDVEAFVGRTTEIERISAALLPGQIVTLLGTGGVGKTRLALQVAHLCNTSFTDGAWFVDLAAVTSADRVVTAVADTIGVADEGTASLLEPIRLALQSRRMLLILDNCEHVGDAVAAMLRGIRSDQMEATVLATSQRGLDVVGEHVEPIAPLSFDGDVTTVEESPAGRLFVMAAQRANPGFDVSAESRVAIAQICRRLDGLPLALELAAARVRVMTVGQIAHELQDRFELLRSRDFPARHRTMSAAVEWSIGLLEPEDRDTFVDLSVFNGSFDWEAAAAVTGRDRFDIVDTLDELLRRSLLVSHGTGTRMLVPLRVHCADELTASGREARIRTRHAAWVSASLPSPIDHLDPAVTATRIDRAVDASEDIHAAHAWLLSTDPPAAASLAMQLGSVWMARSKNSEALSYLRMSDNDATPVELRAELLGWLAAFAWTVGQHDEGEDAARRAISMTESAGVAYPVFAATRLAVRCAFSNRSDEARDLVARIETELAPGSDHASRQLGPLAVVVAVLGDTERAIRLANHGIELARGVGAMRLLSALANRILLDPTSDEVAALTGEVAELASILGRTSAHAHARAALAHQARRRGDLAGFLDGVGTFADLLLLDEPTSVVQMLQWVPPATAKVLPRETAVLVAALSSLGEQYDYRGTDKELARRSAISLQLEEVLGDATARQAFAEGSALCLAEGVDRLHWMTEAVRSIHGSN